MSVPQLKQTGSKGCRVALGKILTLVNGRAYKQEELLSSGTPVIRIQNLNGGDRWYYSNLILPDEKYCQDGDLMFAWSGTFGPYFWRGARAIYHYHIWKVVPSDQLDKKFAFHLLESITGRVKSAGRGISMIHMTKAGMEAWEVNLPPLDEQKRIAAILDKADALRRKRRQALALLDSLTQSIFLEMFGASIETRKLRDVASIRSGSTPSRADAQNFGGAIPWVKTAEVKGRIINSTEETITDVGLRSARLKLYPPGTILIAMYGQGSTRGNIGLLGISATINQACAAIKPGTLLDSTFLFHQLKLKYEEIRSLGRGGNQPNLNLELVGNIDVIVPNLEKQREFKIIIDRLNSYLIIQKSFGEDIDALFASLQHRAFTGQL